MSTGTRAVKSEPVAPKRNWLSEVKSNADRLPARIIVHAVEKFGKTSFAAYAPKVLFGMTHDETGLLTLIAEGRVGETDHLPPWRTWEETRESIEYLRDTDHKFKTLAIDTLNSLAALCADFVCRRDYKGDWGPKGFASYGEGARVCVSEWTSFLALLDQLRERRKMAIVCLCHTKVNAFNNPLGPNYDRYIPDMNEKLWGLSHKWADAIMFGNFEVEVDIEAKAKKGKGQGGQKRVLYTHNTAAYNAGTRYGLPAEIPLGDSGEEAWANFSDAMRAAREIPEPEQKEGV